MTSNTLWLSFYRNIRPLYRPGDSGFAHVQASTVHTCAPAGSASGNSPSSALDAHSRELGIPCAEGSCFAFSLPLSRIPLLITLCLPPYLVVSLTISSCIVCSLTTFHHATSMVISFRYGDPWCVLIHVPPFWTLHFPKATYPDNPLVPSGASRPCQAVPSPRSILPELFKRPAA